MEINKKFLEKLIIKSIINDSTFMSRVVRYLDNDLFSETSYNIIAKFYKDFWNNYSKIPSKDEIKLFTNDINFFNSFKKVIVAVPLVDVEFVLPCSHQPSE